MIRRLYLALVRWFVHPPCPDCRGTGVLVRRACRLCRGRGVV